MASTSTNEWKYTGGVSYAGLQILEYGEKIKDTAPKPVVGFYSNSIC